MKALQSRTPSVADEIESFNRDRIRKLVRLKYRRIADDPFAFLRGTDHLFASYWQRYQPKDVGPAILICGDLHLENYGAYEADDGGILYDINDFDEAIVAPCGLDIVRCCTSILLAAELWKLTPVEAMRTLLAFLDRYRLTVAKSIATGRTGEIAMGGSHGPIWKFLKDPVRADEARFLKHFTEQAPDGTRRIERKSGRFKDLDRSESERIRHAVEAYGKGLGAGSSVEVLDVAFRIAGIGSLGLERYAVLAKGQSPSRPFRLLDLKEVRASALLPCGGAEMQAGGGDAEVWRVVGAQRKLQSRAALGLDLIKPDDGRSLRIRELVPEENRSGLDVLKDRPKRLRRAVGVAGRLAGWAHVRGCRVAGDDRSRALGEWAAGAGLESAIASAVRYAEQTRLDHHEFCKSGLA